jgi:hypothetical protein
MGCWGSFRFGAAGAADRFADGGSELRVLVERFKQQRLESGAFGGQVCLLGVPPGAAA